MRRANANPETPLGFEHMAGPFLGIIIFLPLTMISFIIEIVAKKAKKGTKGQRKH